MSVFPGTRSLRRTGSRSGEAGFAFRSSTSCLASPGRLARFRRHSYALTFARSENPEQAQPLLSLYSVILSTFRASSAHACSVRIPPSLWCQQSSGQSFIRTCIFRRGRDSNPRCSHPHNSLAGSPIQPLSHLSKSVKRVQVTSVWAGRSNPPPCGGGGIRTHGRLPRTGFQDRLLKPLGHPSITGYAN